MILFLIYSVFVFMRTKVHSNLTHLYLIKIIDWCLIFCIMFGHLIIHKEIKILMIMLLVNLGLPIYTLSKLKDLMMLGKIFALPCFSTISCQKGQTSIKNQFALNLKIWIWKLMLYKIHKTKSWLLSSINSPKTSNAQFCIIANLSL